LSYNSNVDFEVNSNIEGPAGPRRIDAHLLFDLLLQNHSNDSSATGYGTKSKKKNEGNPISEGKLHFPDNGHRQEKAGNICNDAKYCCNSNYIR